MSMTAAELARYYDESVPPGLLAPDPTIGTLVPSTGSAAAGAITVQVTGSNFEPSSVVEVDQVAQPTTYVSATRLTATYDPTTAGTVQFTVRNASGRESNNSAFTVTALGE